MAEENEIKVKVTKKEEQETKKGAATASKKEAKPSVKSKINVQKIKTIFGVLLALLSVYLFLAFTSYLFNPSDNSEFQFR